MHALIQPNPFVFPIVVFSVTACDETWLLPHFGQIMITPVCVHWHAIINDLS